MPPKNILSIDTSAKHAQVAVLRDGEVAAEFDAQRFELQEPRPITGAGDNVTSESRPASGVPEQPAGSQKSRSPVLRPGVSALLTPMIHATIEASGLQVGDFDLLALTTGPGSFTGLRVGVVTAKAFAFALDVPVIGVNTLEVIAAKLTQQSQTNGEEVSVAPAVHVALNAQRQQWFTGTYRASNESVAASSWQVESLRQNSLEDPADWLNGLAAGDVVTGAGLRLIDQTLLQSAEQERGFSVAPESTWDCDAVSVARVAMKHFDTGRRDDPWSLKPIYFRPSAAEEKRLASKP